MRYLIPLLFIGLGPTAGTVGLCALATAAPAAMEDDTYSVRSEGDDWGELDGNFLHDSGLKDMYDSYDLYLWASAPSTQPQGTPPPEPTAESDQNWAPGESNSWDLPSQCDMFEDFEDYADFDCA